MRVKLQLVMCNDQGEEETVTDVITLNKNNQRIEHLGLSLAESKQLLSTLQRHLLQQQITTFLDTCSDCPDCGTPLQLKARATGRFAPCLAPLRSIVRGWSIVTASGERPRHFGRCRLCLPSRSPQSFSIWNRSGPLWCPTG